MNVWNDIQSFFINLPWVDIGIAVLIFVLIYLFRDLFTKYLFRLIIKLFSKTPTPLFTNLLLSYEKPLRFFFSVLGIYVALIYLPLSPGLMETVTTIYRCLVIVTIGWGLYNYFSTKSYLFTNMAKKIDVGEDSMMVPFLSKLFRFIIIALTLTVVAFELDYDINGFIAGLGLGGLAFALAAQDTIGNFFGGIIIITERPFKKGDWIQTPTVEGFIEDISFRSTKVRTFEDSLVTVPNSTLAHEPITNWNEMEVRRIDFTIGVKYSTPKGRLQNCVARIDNYLQAHPQIDNDLILVRFSDFGQSSLNIFIYFYTIPTGWVDWYNVKEEVNYKIMDILKEEGVEIALPSQNLYISSEEDEKLLLHNKNNTEIYTSDR
ncbi:mechanosensitive ion channel family protein [Bacillus sp. FJAT-44742]|uniref:mechanosensitive ion channel family protein n=1 Tax=Bacillus sp. FJAT-44742 TaxID=2014005 RepID=UPI001E4BCF7A|nr:mechanosensitive ion channel family protein [Bacillus sp. FJAT-44742]